LAAEPQAAKDGKAGRLQKEAGADGSRSGETLEQDKPVAGAGQKQRRRHPGDSAANHGDVESMSRHQVERQRKMSPRSKSRFAGCEMLTLRCNHRAIGRSVEMATA